MIRVYAETSVYGGVFDEEFAISSKKFFDIVNAGRFKIVTSYLLEEEIQYAPLKVGEFFMKVYPVAEFINVSREAIQLRNSYIKAGIVSPQSMTDAMHVALGSIANCSIILSWNFKHIVNFSKIPLYNAVNKIEGYQEIAIHSPLEVIEND